jgi:GH43 family beta-xylosidase
VSHKILALVALVNFAAAGCGDDSTVRTGNDASASGGDDLSSGAAADLASGVSDGGGSDLGGGDLGRADLGGGSADLGGGSADLGGGNASCSTRITYGNFWIAPASHPNDYDVVSGAVTWDGVCTDDGANSYATLSNGWKPYFTGHGGCVMALDQTGCAGAPTACATRVSYGAAWEAPAGHTNRYDDVAGRVTWNRACASSSASSTATLSNGWTPTFTGSASCDVSLAYTQCGGLYVNSVLPSGCADPGVLHDGSRYLVACTSGDAGDAFPIYSSPDMVNWTASGHIFPSASKPKWAMSDFWAPEIHKVGADWVAYFTARNTDGMLSIGAASATSPTGPFVDSGAPLVHDSAMGLIDATEFQDANGSLYLLWKEDGNAVGKPTPIHGQPLAANGLALTGSASTLITNDQAWEGAVTEGPWLYAHDGSYYLLYSGNSYANATYAVGVARAASPLGPYTKASAPILVSNAAWIGPGHCSVTDGPGGDTYMVYHAWIAGHVNGAGDARVLMDDRIVWNNGWPALPGAPSTTSMPMP